MKKLFIYLSALLFSIAGIYSCDSTTAPESKIKDYPAVTHFSVSPNEVVFTQEHGFVDTTFTVTVKAGFTQIDSTNIPLLVVTDKNSGNIILEQPMNLAIFGIKTYALSFDISTTTTSFEDYIINLIYDEELGSYAQTHLQVIGFSNARPELISANNPRTASLPSAGTKAIEFTAKATDSDGQNTIDGVYLDLISQVTGSVNQFELYDDGNSGEDETANDSTFTITLEINSGNQLQTYDIHYYSVDKGGLISDTIKTTFSIVE